jgi:hypothetical protein
MADDYVALPFVADQAQIADDAITRLQARWSDWTPNDADLESIFIEELAPMAADLATLAAAMPPEALQVAGADLFQIPALAATSAQTTVTLTAQDTAGYTVYAGAQIEIDGYAFDIVSDVVIAPGGATAAAVPVVADVAGSDANGLTGALTASISVPIYITAIVVDADTAGGTDDEDPNTYLSRLSRALRLRSKTLVTTTDYEIEATEQAGVGRAHATATVSTKTMVVTVTDALGAACTSGVKTALQADFNFYTLSNWTVLVADSTYHAVAITYVCKAYPGYDTTDLQARINAALTGALGPAEYSQLFGGPGANQWWNAPTIRANQLIALIGNIQGVDYVTSVQINALSLGADYTMSGTVPLPTAGTMIGTVT